MEARVQTLTENFEDFNDCKKCTPTEITEYSDGCKEYNTEDSDSSKDYNF